MHILLPPSETKRSGGGSIFAPKQLAHDQQLAHARSLVRDALVELSRDEELAAKALKLGVNNRAESQLNLHLDDSAAMPAVLRYTGVLYDSLGATELDADAHKWLADHVSVQSALFGLISAADQIPAYRLSASSRLAGLAKPLKRTWGEAHAQIEWQHFGWVLDLRSKDYVALAPLPEGVGAWLNVAQRGPDGTTRALNHFNKAAKGNLVRLLARSGAELNSADECIEWAAAHDVEILRGEAEGELTLVTTFGAPAQQALLTGAR